MNYLKAPNVLNRFIKNKKNMLQLLQERPMHFKVCDLVLAPFLKVLSTRRIFCSGIF